MKEVAVNTKETNDEGWIFNVTVTRDITTNHTVTLTKEYWSKLTKETIPPEELVHLSFKFLLARESNESILRKFDLPVIQTYFPAYESEIIKHD